MSPWSNLIVLHEIVLRQDSKWFQKAYLTTSKFTLQVIEYSYLFIGYAILLG